NHGYTRHWRLGRHIQWEFPWRAPGRWGHWIWTNKKSLRPCAPSGRLFPATCKCLATPLAADRSDSWAQILLLRSVLILSAGNYGNVIRLLMPLVISDEQLAEAREVLEAAIGSVFHSPVVA